MKKIFLIFLVFFGMLFTLQAEKVTLTVIEKASEQAVAAKVLEEIFNKAGMEVDFIYGNGGSNTVTVAAGKANGEAARIAAFGETYKKNI